MIDKFTFEECQKNLEVLDLKINNLEHAIKQSQEMVKESKLDNAALTFLRRKVSASLNELEHLYILKQQKEKP